MQKVALVWSSLTLLTLAGCSGDGPSRSGDGGTLGDASVDDVGSQTDANITPPMPSDHDGGPVSCTPQNYQTECPERPCEVLESCSGGLCTYVPWVCGRATGCPREQCVATPRGGGGYDNRCIQPPNDGCANGETCRNAQCLSVDQGLNLWHAGFTSEGAGAAPQSGLQLKGQFGSLRPGQGFGSSQDGSLRLSGGLVSHGIRSPSAGAQ